MPDFQQYIGVRYSGRKDPGDPIREIKVFAAVEVWAKKRSLSRSEAAREIIELGLKVKK